MAISVTVQNKFQIIVPVRVDRAVSSVAPALDAPDVDDRGWVNNRASGLNVDNARGSLFGMTVGDTVRLRVVREDIDPSVPLFVTVSGDQASIATPGGGPLPASGIFSVQAVADTTVGTKIEVRLGTAGGPVICEADAHVFSPLTLNVTPHICTIHQAAAAASGSGQPPSVNGTAMDDTVLGTIFDLVKAIWRPCAVTFNIAAAENEVFTGFTTDDVALGAQMRTVMAQNRASGRCNIYFMRYTNDFLGLGLRFETRDDVIDDAGTVIHNSGIFIGVEGTKNATGVSFTRPSTGANLVQELGNDVAHELGHFMTLPHADHVNADPAAGTPNGRLDTYCRRQLMHPNNTLPDASTANTATSVPRFDDIGYGLSDDGSGHRGCLVTLKDHPKHTSDGEAMDARRRFRSTNLYK